jgi:hypothetical protein
MVCLLKNIASETEELFFAGSPETLCSIGGTWIAGL